MAIPEKFLTLTVLIISVVAALFCVIGLGTKGWVLGEYGLFIDAMPNAPKALSVLSFILLIGTIVALVLQLIGFLRERFQLIPVIILFVVTIFLLGTIAGATEKGFGYSYDLIIVAHFLSYLAFGIAAYSLGQLAAGASA